MEHDLAAVRRIGGRGVDRRAVGELDRAPAAQVHGVDVRGTRLLEAHDDALPVRREARREGHARKRAHDLLLPGLDVEQIDLGVAALEGHVGDLLRRRAEARGQHQVLSGRQQPHVVAVLVHDGEAFDPSDKDNPLKYITV